MAGSPSDVLGDLGADDVAAGVGAGAQSDLAPKGAILDSAGAVAGTKRGGDSNADRATGWDASSSHGFFPVAGQVGKGDGARELAGDAVAPEEQPEQAESEAPSSEPPPPPFSPVRLQPLPVADTSGGVPEDLPQLPDLPEFLEPSAADAGGRASREEGSPRRTSEVVPEPSVEFVEENASRGTSKQDASALEPEFFEVAAAGAGGPAPEEGPLEQTKPEAFPEENPDPPPYSPVRLQPSPAASTGLGGDLPKEAGADPDADGSAPKAAASEVVTDAAPSPRSVDVDADAHVRAPSGTSPVSDQGEMEAVRGDRVMACGLEQATAFNGRRGRIESRYGDMYSVQFFAEHGHRGVKAKLRRENFRVVTKADGSVRLTGSDSGTLELVAAEAEAHDDSKTMADVNKDERLSSCPCIVTTLTRYTAVVKRRPCCMIAFYLVCMIVILGVFWREFELDEDFSTFVNADGQAMRNRAAYLLALKEQGDLEPPPESRRLREKPFGAASGPEVVPLANLTAVESRRGQQTLPNFLERSITLFYVARSGDALSDRALRDQRDLELELRTNPSWQRYCTQKVGIPEERWLCNPGESFAAMAYPAQEKSTDLHPNQRFSLKFNGSGEDLLPLPAVFAQFEAGWKDGSGDRSRNLERYFPKTFDKPDVLNGAAEIGHPVALRTKFTFMLTFGDVSDPLSKRRQDTEKTEAEYEKFIMEIVYPILQKARNKYVHIDVFYSGHVIQSYEITSTLWTDILWAIGSIIFVTVFMWFHMGSLLLACGGFFIIFASVPMAYVMTPVAKTTIASFLSLFLVTVIDIDVIFVFIDMWDQSAHMSSIENRLVWMILRAGKSTLATSLTTSLSFFANLASALQPLREFGLFMGLSVMSVYVFALLFIPPLVVIKERGEQRVHARVVDISMVNSRAMSLEVAQPGGPCLSGPRDKKKPRLTNLMLAKLVDQISRCSCAVVCVTALTMPIFVWGIATQITVNTGIPKIFPDGHNQAESERYAGEFGNVPSMADIYFTEEERRPITSGMVCETYSMGVNNPSPENWSDRCILNWCQVHESYDTPSLSNGTCWQSPTEKISPGGTRSQMDIGSTRGCDSVEVISRIAIPEDTKPSVTETTWRVSWQAKIDKIAPGISLAAEDDASDDNGSSVVWYDRTLYFPDLQWREQMPQAFEDWEAGLTSMSSLWETSLRACRYPVEEEGRLICPNPTDEDFARTRCEIHTMCFFDTQVCKSPEGWEQADLVLNLDRVFETLPPSPAPLTPPPPLGRRLQAPGRPREGFRVRGEASLSPLAKKGLQTPRGNQWRQEMPRRLDSGMPVGIQVPAVADNKRFDVTIVYGLRASRSTPLVGKWDEYWSFDPAFDPSNPWAQRSMHSMCTNAVLHEELWVMDPNWWPGETYCWVWEFKTWLEENKRPYPSRNFNFDFPDWYTRRPDVKDYVQQDVWMQDGKMKATKFSLTVDEAWDMPRDRALEYKKKWDAFVEAENAQAQMTAGHAWNTAQVWVALEAEEAIISSTVETIVIELGCSWLGLLVFTGDLILAFLVVGLVIINISGLAFFMTAIMHWPVGPIEVICLVVFVGFSVTYGLHIAHNFSRVGTRDPKFLDALRKIQKRKHKSQARSADDVRRAPDVAEVPRRTTPFEVRVARTRVAMLRMGGAVLSSTVSTIGGSIFLLFCTLTIFLKLGAVIMCVTVLSVCFTLISLPAVLITLGPSEDPCYNRIPREAFRRLTGQASAPRLPSRVSSDSQEEPLIDDHVDVLY